MSGEAQVLDGELLGPDADDRKRALLMVMRAALKASAAQGLNLSEFEGVVAQLVGDTLSAAGVQDVTPHLTLIAGMTRSAHSAAVRRARATNARAAVALLKSNSYHGGEARRRRGR